MPDVQMAQDSLRTAYVQGTPLAHVPLDWLESTQDSIQLILQQLLSLTVSINHSLALNKTDIAGAGARCMQRYASAAW